MTQFVQVWKEIKDGEMTTDLENGVFTPFNMRLRSLRDSPSSASDMCLVRGLGSFIELGKELALLVEHRVGVLEAGTKGKLTREVHAIPWHSALEAWGVLFGKVANTSDGNRSRTITADGPNSDIDLASYAAHS